MNFYSILKITPLISSLLLIIFLNLTNHKKDTKLKILIWNTPTLPLATYLSLSTGAGFILSYIITSNLAKINQSNINKKIKYKDDVNEQIEYSEKSIDNSYERSLIERDIKDPSPTMNASFRVIGKTELLNREYINNKAETNNNFADSNEIEDQFYEQTEVSDNNYQDKSYSTDWNDESFLKW
tara:strand:+ start:57 stop:605 length:549 start_codon:yes stop_codon:yes gene_type:complete